jgi:hypothetical protein
MYYIPNWFLPSFFSFLSLSHLMVISSKLNILYSFLYRKYINHIHLIFLLLTLPHPKILPLSWPVFHSCPSLLRCLFIVQWDFCLGIIPVYVLCLSQSNHPPLHFLALVSLILCYWTVFGLFP